MEKTQWNVLLLGNAESIEAICTIHCCTEYPRNKIRLLVWIMFRIIAVGNPSQLWWWAGATRSRRDLPPAPYSSVKVRVPYVCEVKWSGHHVSDTCSFVMYCAMNIWLHCMYVTRPRLQLPAESEHDASEGRVQFCHWGCPPSSECYQYRRYRSVRICGLVGMHSTTTAGLCSMYLCMYVDCRCIRFQREWIQF